MHEFAYGTHTMNKHFGYVRNPFDTERTVGGSSGGSGAAVGSGVFAAALATDTGGSIRVPATWNSTYGYKPTVGRWSADFGIKMTHTNDTIGPITNNIEDIILLDNVITG